MSGLALLPATEVKRGDLIQTEPFGVFWLVTQALEVDGVMTLTLVNTGRPVKVEYGTEEPVYVAVGC